MKKISLLICCLLFLGTSYSQKIMVDQKYLNSGKKLDTEKVLQTIAFGSCNDQTKSQDMWKYVVMNRPDLWIWLGDNIYADTKDMKRLAEKYTIQKNYIDYQRLLACSPVIGTWDDHDYGVNDGGKEHSTKQGSQQLMLDFLDVPKNALVRSREGVYQSYTFGQVGKKIKVILLDTRFFRDELKKGTDGKSRYQVNTEGDVLGGKQWRWLEKQLTNSEAQIHLICTSIQLIPEEHGYEKWANFPKARDHFFKVLEKTNPNMPIILSGDRHVAEISKINLKGLEHPVYEITSSGLTHSWSAKSFEPNQYRVKEMVVEKNFAVMKIDWSVTVPKVFVEIRGLGNELYLKQKL